MRTRIISAFPGTGKTYYYENHKDTSLDSDSSLFSWVIKDGVKVRNPDFPNNYINHIKENIGKYEFIFVSSHKEVRETLLDNCIFFYLIYPDESVKELYLQRYRDRGNPETFVNLIATNWDAWIKECWLDDTGCENIRMHFDSLTKEIDHICI